MATKALARATSHSHLTDRRSPTRAPLEPTRPNVGAATAQLLGTADTGFVQRMMTEMQGTAGNAAVQRMIAGRRHAATAQRLQARAGRGRPLEPAVQRKVGQALGADLSTVQVHDDDEADQLATSLGAEAFTSGHDIYFTKGAYDPSSEKGLKTVAHEATHVVQQSSGPVDGASIGGGITVSDPSDRFERAAEATAEEVVAGGKAHPGGRGQLPAGGGGAGPAVQRKCGCGGSCGPCRGSGEKDLEEAATGPVQRLASPSSPLSIQRAPLPAEKLGDVDVIFNPSATLTAIEPGSDTPKPQSKDPASPTITFDEIARGSRGDVKLDVDMKFFKKADNPGPPGQCDVCAILAEALTIDLPFPLPDIKAPQFLIDECRKLVRVDLNAVEPLLDKLEDAAQDPCNLLKFIDAGDFLVTVCEGGNLAIKIFLPHIGEIIQSIQLRVLKGVAAARRALRKCQGQKPPTPTPAGKEVGTARATLSANFVHNPDGTFSFSGLPPTPQKTGSGANLKLPVDFDRGGAGPVGFVTEQPILTGEGANGGVLAKAFRADMPTTKPPANADFLCTGQFGPFKVASAQFEQDDKKIQELRTYYFGMHPKIRQHLETGKGQLLVTGRASTTGSQAKNLGFAQARADRVRKILRGFAGENAQFNAFSLGELGAQTAGEVGGERRADVESRGTVLEGGALDSPCAGHEAEPTPSGATQPVTEGEGIRETQGGEAAPADVAASGEKVSAQQSDEGAVLQSELEELQSSQPVDLFAGASGDAFDDSFAPAFA